jgi:YVTN family beta-propeller protein
MVILGAALLIIGPGSLHATVPDDTLYVTNSGSNTVSEVNEGTGNVTTFVPSTAGLNDPFGIVFAPDGDLYVANETHGIGNGYISQITLGGIVTGTFATIGSTPDGLAVNSAGDLFAVNFGTGGDTGSISEIPTTGPDAGVPTTIATGLDEPTGDVIGPNGTLYVAEATNNIYSVSLTTGSLTLYATNDENPTGLTFDSQSNLYASGLSNGVIYKYTDGGADENPFATGFISPEGLAFDSAGNLLVANLGSGDGGGSSSSEITILDSSGNFIEEINGFADPAYMVDVSVVPEPRPWAMLAAGAPCVFVIGRRRRRVKASRRSLTSPRSKSAAGHRAECRRACSNPPRWRCRCAGAAGRFLWRRWRA